MSIVAKFWFERLRAGTLLKEHRQWELFVITDKLHSEYINFATEIGDRYRLADSQFGKELRNLCASLWRGRREIEGRNRWVLYVPELDTCREAFEARLGRKINWQVASTQDENTLF
jgi:hypothetical protein